MGLVYPVFSSMFFHGETSALLPEASNSLKGLWLGVLLAAMPLSQFVSAPILGSFSDRSGRKPILILTLLLSVAGYVVCTLGVQTKNLLFLLIGRCIVGVAAGNTAIATSVIAELSLPSNKAKNFGLLHMAAGVGFTIGPFFGGKLSEQGFLGIGGFDKPFLFAALLTLFNSILLVLFFKETHCPKEKSNRVDIIPLKGIRKFLTSRRLGHLLVSVFVFRFGWAFYWEFIPVMWMEEHGLSVSRVGAFYAYAAGFYALSCGLLIRPIIGKLQPLITLFFALILTGFCILLSITIDPHWLWAYLPIQQYLTALLFPTTATIVSNWSMEEIQGEMMGVYQSVESLAFGLSPLMTGYLVGVSYKMPIFVGGISMFIASLILGMGCSKEAFAKDKEAL